MIDSQKTTHDVSRRAFLALSLAAGLGGISALSACSQATQSTDSSSTTSTNQTSKDDPSKTSLLSEPLDNGYKEGIHHATIEVDQFGTIELELNATNTPITVSNFADLVNQHFYDGLTFHRIISGFMAQGGDPNGDGTGGSARKIVGEFSENGIVNAIQHKRGTISMARSAGYNSASSQFFIMHQDSSSLDGKYAAFGKVTSGMDVIDAMCERIIPSDNNGSVPKDQQPRITSIVMVD